MKSIFRFSQQLKIIQQKNQILYFQNIPFTKLGTILQAPSNNLGFVIAIMQSHSIALMFNQINPDHQITLLSTNSLYLPTNTNPYTIQSITNQQTKFLINGFKPFVRRSNSKKQIYTSNLFIDLFHPISFGQFIQFYSPINFKTITSQFNQVVISTNNPNRKIPDATYFISKNQLADDYYLPNAALSYATHQAQLEPTLLIVENLKEHLRANQTIQSEIVQAFTNQNSSSIVHNSKLLGELAERAGHRKNFSNLTVIAIHDSTQDDIDVVRLALSKEVTQLQSQMYKVGIHDLSHDSQNSLSQNSVSFQFTFLIKYASLCFKMFYAQREQYKMHQQLDIHIEPWDFYHYLDGKILNEMIKEFNKLEGRSYIDMIILSQWIVRAMNQDVASLLNCKEQFIKIYLLESGRELVQDLLQFIETFKDENDVLIRDFFQEKIELMGDTKEFQEYMIEHINRFCELHVLNLRMNNKLLAQRKAHF